MTREEAVRKFNASTIGRRESLSMAMDWIEVFEALGLLKFEDSEDDKMMIKAKKYSGEFIKHNINSPYCTIEEMSEVIKYLLGKVNK